MKTLLTAALLVLLTLQVRSQARSQLEGFAQGTSWSITYYSYSASIAKAAVDSLFKSIDSSLSRYKNYSLISRLNRASGGIKSDSHLLRVVARSIATNKDTKGAFDITYQSDCKPKQPLLIRGDSILKADSCIVIDVDGIAQGYTVDLIADYLLKSNITDFIVELGGEIRTSGSKPLGEPFKVGIESATADIQKIISLRNGAITTSGNYRKKQHIIDPVTGKAVANELISVTLFATDAITADAYDNALMVMGLKKALRFVNRRKYLAAHFIYRSPDGNFAQKESRRFARLFQ